MISRRFCNADGKLFQLRKQTWSVDAGAKSPKGVLWGKEFYGPPGNLLDRIYTRIENEFGKIYDELCGADKVSRKALDTFIQFSAAQATRTPFVGLAFNDASLAGDSLAWARVSETRLWMWRQTLQIFRQDWWGWRRLCLPEDGEPLLLTDHPACFAPRIGSGGLFWLFPLSPYVVYVGGERVSLGSIDEHDVQGLNLMLLGAAVDRVYSGNKGLLDQLQASLSPDRDGGDTEIAAVLRAPSFGDLAEPSGAPDWLKSVSLVDAAKIAFMASNQVGVM